MNLKVVLCLAVTALVGLSACKKTDKSGGAASMKMEKLGDLVPKNALGFNFAGEPLMYLNSSVYEWSNNGKSWRRIGDTISPRFSGATWQYVQDKLGVYYISDGVYIYSCANPAENWVRVDFPGVPYSDNAYLIANGLGDIVAGMRGGNDSAKLFLKKAQSTEWNQLSISPSAYQVDRPSFFCNNGNLYLGNVLDRYLNTNTNQVAMLYDRTDPANAAIGGRGYLDDGYIYVQASGTIYFLKGNDLFKFDGNVLPAKATKVITFTNPLKDQHDGDLSWSRTLGSFAVDDAGNIKVLASCNKYPNTHWSYITGNIGKSTMTLQQHDLSQRGIVVNLKNEVFMAAYLGDGWYKWQ